MSQPKACLWLLCRLATQGGDSVAHPGIIRAGPQNNILFQGLLQTQGPGNVGAVRIRLGLGSVLNTIHNKEFKGMILLNIQLLWSV